MAETPLPVQFKKMYAQPINPDSVFDTMLLAKNYVNGPLAAAGEAISIRDENSFKYSYYIINGDKTVSKISANSTIINDKGEEVSVSMDEVVDTLRWKELK